MADKSDQRFRLEREAGWQRLDGLLQTVEKGATSALDDRDLIEMPGLYRHAIASLAVGRAKALDTNLLENLESLCRRAYFLVYGVDETLGARVRQFVLRDWNRAVRDLLPEFGLSILLTVLGFMAAWALVARQPETFYILVPGDLIQGRDPAASVQALIDPLHQTADMGRLTAFSFALFTHNAQVAFLSFALGFALCVPSALLMLYDGATLGAMMAVYAKHGLALDFLGWFSIHGVTETIAISLAGAGGLRIGRALMLPGQDERFVSLRKHGKSAGTVILGTVIMLIVAGALEGIGRQVLDSTIIRFLVGGVSLWLWIAYLFMAPADEAPR